MILSKYPYSYNIARCINNRSYKSKCLTRSELYKKCCYILCVPETADQTTVRLAYIQLVKSVHPDSGQPEASEERFREVDEAFKILQQKFARSRHGVVENEHEDVADISHTAPQHRQYLNHDGFGAGNPYQREKQYQHIRAMKAQERVLKHRLDKIAADETSLIDNKSSKMHKHNIKTKYGFERIVEDYIQEAMSRGDFDNLKDAGKPLKNTDPQNPHVDFTTHKLNQILLNNGFLPEWITLQRDIRTAIKKLRAQLENERSYFGKYPLHNEEDQEWQITLKKFIPIIKQINQNIDKYNLIVPLIGQQLCRINIMEISHEILTNPNILTNQKKTVPKGGSTSEMAGTSLISTLMSSF